MPVPDLSNIRALIADERAEVRDLLSTTLRVLGVTSIDSVAAGIAGTNVVALMARNALPPADETGGPPAEDIADLVTRFSHDVASPLMGVLALTELLIQGGQLGKPAEEDLRNIRSAAEEIAGMVRALSEQVAVGRPPDAS
jgi:signal transduction histidine kinase